MLPSPSQRNQTGIGCGAPAESTVVSQASFSSRRRRAARCPNSVDASRRLTPRPYPDRPSACTDGAKGKSMHPLSFAILLTFAAAVLINWAWIREHDAASALPPLSVRRPRESLTILLTDRSWLTGFLTETGG